MESGWNLWGVVSGRQEGVESMGMASGCGCKMV